MNGDTMNIDEICGPDKPRIAPWPGVPKPKPAPVRYTPGQPEWTPPGRPYNPPSIQPDKPPEQKPQVPIQPYCIR